MCQQNDGIASNEPAHIHEPNHRRTHGNARWLMLSNAYMRNEREQITVCALCQ